MRLPHFPSEAAATISSSPVVEFATLTSAGVPLDTPLLSFVADDGTTVDVTTGVSYPTKAERARNRPTVGLCFRGDGTGPVVAMSAIASVRDRDVQNNAERYIRQTGPVMASLAGGRAWDELREAVWYFCRIWIECAPVRVLTWTDGLDRPPLEWQRPQGPPASQSDPPPSGRPTKSPHWPDKDWRVSAQEAVENLPLPYLTAIDADGVPLPFPVTAVKVAADGLDLEVPAGAPWDLAGPASVCFDGRATFLGTLEGAHLAVERQLPDLPLVSDTSQIFDPDPELRHALMNRLLAELDRRGQALPTIPDQPPPGFGH